MRTTGLFLAALGATAGAAAMTTSHVVIRQVSLPAMECDGSTMGAIELNSFAVTSLCSAYVSCDEAGARPGGGAPVEFPDLAGPARDQARDLDCVGVCRCLPRPAASSSREPPVGASDTAETRVVNATVAHTFEA